TICRALQAGKHVLVEKPLAITVKACRAVRDAAQVCGRTVAVAENFRRMVSNRALKHILDAELIGNPRYAIVEYVVDSLELFRGVISGALPQTQSWYLDPAKVGNLAMLELAVHETDLLRYWFGDAESATGMTSRFHEVSRAPRPMEDTAF